jgi:transposase
MEEREGTGDAGAGMPLVNLNAAGLDIGASEIWACVPGDRDAQAVRQFGTFTPDLHDMAGWLVRCGIDTVAMESTGVYWIPAYEILEECGLRVYLVNARHVKNVPGRKSDVQDCQWIQRLHSCGLLNASFRPESDICTLRGYLRHRANLIEHRAAHIQHMQKALQQMNLQLTQVLSDITGTTGMAILRAIVAGEHNPLKLAALRNERCAKSQAQIANALTGNYRPEHLFALKQSLALYDAYNQQIRECDAEIERQFSVMKPRHDDDLPALHTGDKTNTHSKNGPPYDARTLLYRLLGVDLVAVTGLNASTVQTIISEIGTDMTRWPSVKHFSSWLQLAPHNDISGGKVLRSHIPKARNRAGQALRLAAQSLARSSSALGAYFRHMRGRCGAKNAIVATAHKLARIIYTMLKHRTPFHDIGADDYELRLRQRHVARLHKTAAKLGFTLQPIQVSE